MSSKSYPAVAARGLAVCQSPFCRSSLVTACTERGILGALGNISHVFKLNGGVLFFQQHDTQGIPNSYSGHSMPMSMVHQELDFLLCKLLHTRVAVAHPAQLWDPPHGHSWVSPCCLHASRCSPASVSLPRHTRCRLASYHQALHLLSPALSFARTSLCSLLSPQEEVWQM